MGKPTVFFSYSHKDREWEGRLRPHLGLLERAGRITLWNDRRIDTGAKAMVAETDYHRRDGEVAALEQETGDRSQETGVR